MAVLRLSEFSLSVGSTQLLDSVNAHLVAGQRVALVGPNGSGKSTLLRALAGAGNGNDDDPYFVIGSGNVAGTVALASGPDNDETASRILHVEQDDLQWSTLFPNVADDEAELREMTLPDILDMAIACAGDDCDGAVEDAEAWRVLSLAASEALEWSTAGYDETPVGELSPGCGVRAYLAVALRRHAVDVLLLDEPTNHLDLPSILWLQHAVVASGKTVVIVSHDSAFLDAVVDHLWVVVPEAADLVVSGASYSDYRAAEALAREQHVAAYESQQKRHKKLTAAAGRLRVASARGERAEAPDRDKLQNDFRRDRAGRSGRKAKAVEKLRDQEPQLERLVDRSVLEIEIDPVGAGGDAAIILSEVVLGHSPDTPLPLAPVDLRVDFGERVAIVGFNGVGKSTLLKTVTGAIEPLGGDVCIGRELQIGNLTQEHETLPRDATPREHVCAMADIEPVGCAKFLISYGLTYRQVDCPIEELNPGARARMLLALFALRRVNVLILDEPTNHLDEEAIEEVGATLNAYAGTILVVSHSRPFLEGLALTRTLRLGAAGLSEVSSIESFVAATDEAARAVVSEWFG